MPTILIYGLLLFGIVWLIKTAWRILESLPAALVMSCIGLFFLLAVFDGHMQRSHPIVGEVSLVGSAIRSVPNRMAPIYLNDMVQPGSINWLSLRLKNTDGRDHRMNVAVCSIKGPIYYDSNHLPAWQDMSSGYHPAKGGFINKFYAEATNKTDQTFLGERRMIVKLISVQTTTLGEGWRMDDTPILGAAERTWWWQTPTTHEASFIYLVGFPKLRLFDDDKVEWCKFGESVADLPQDQLEPRVEWVGQHVDVPIERVVLDNDVAPKVLQAVMAAQF